MKYRKSLGRVAFLWFVGWAIVGGFGIFMANGPTVRQVELAKHMRHAAFACDLLLPLAILLLYPFTRWIIRGPRS